MLYLGNVIISKNGFYFALLPAIFFELPITRTPDNSYFFRFPLKVRVAREQALCLGKKKRGKGREGVERACRQTFEAAIPPSCNYPADHLSLRSLSGSVNQFRA